MSLRQCPQCWGHVRMYKLMARNGNWDGGWPNWVIARSDRKPDEPVVVEYGVHFCRTLARSIWLGWGYLEHTEWLSASYGGDILRQYPNLEVDRPIYEPLIVEHTASPIMGFRTWDINQHFEPDGTQTIVPGLYPVGVGVGKWGPTINQARCAINADSVSRPPEHGPTPELACSCGFYAFNAIPDPGDAYGPVWGIIEAAGRIIMCKRGFRAERARIIALSPRPFELFHDGRALQWRHDIGKMIAQNYPDVKLYDDWHDMATAHNMEVEQPNPQPL